MNIPNFDIDRELGKGGMATVYLARQVLLHRQVALKVMDPALGREQGFLDKFLDEGRIVAQLEHPNIVRVYDVGIAEDSSSVYMAMEYLPGGSLKDKLVGGKLPLDATLQILGQVGAGLGLAHAQGFIHRDIKPANILFRKDGTAVLTDFGIAKLQDSTGELTRMGYTLGTVKYMSPEQASTTQLDRRSDIYSLGLVFFEMLTGKAAVAAESTAQALHSHVALPPPALPAEYAWLQPVLNTVLAKTPAERYPTVDAFVSAVREAADPQKTLLITPTMAKADAASTRPTQIVAPPAPTANHKPLWISSLVGLLLLAVAAAAFHWFSNPLDSSKQLTPPAPPPTATADQPANQGATLFPVGGEATQHEKINLVFDASGSMNQKLDGVPKIDIARSVLKNVVAGWDGNTERGLLVYGHRKRGDCDDIEQVVPVGAANQQAFIAQADHLTAMGETPIAKALLMAAEDLQYTESKATVILVSDGKEECGGDPCAVAKQLKQRGIDFTAHVIGFAVKDQAAGEQLRCIAEATGGHYQAAQDREEFQSMLAAAQTGQATPAPKPPPTPATPPPSPPPASQPPDVPPATPPPAATGVLKVVSISSRTGQPLPADISVYRLDDQSAVPSVDAFALLGVNQAQAAERVAFRQGVTEASFTLKAGKYRVNVRSAEDRQTFDVTVNAGKTVSKRVAMQDPAPKPEPPPNPEPQQPEPQPNPEPQQPEPQPNPEPQQPEPQPNPEPQQPAAKPAMLLLNAVNKATGKAVDANFTVTQDKRQVASASGSSIRIGSLPAGEYRIAATSGRLLRGGASVTLTAGEQRQLTIPLTPIIITPPHIQLPEATQPEPEPPKPTTPIKPEVIRPEIIKPEVIRPEIIKPEVIRPEIIKPELLRPELLKPVTPLRPETLKPESPAPAPSAQPAPKEAAPQLDDVLKQKLQGELFKRLNQ